MSVTVRKAEVKVRKFYFGMQMSAFPNFYDGELEVADVRFPPISAVSRYLSFGNLIPIAKL